MEWSRETDMSQESKPQTHNAAAAVPITKLYSGGWLDLVSFSIFFIFWAIYILALANHSSTQFNSSGTHRAPRQPRWPRDLPDRWPQRDLRDVLGRVGDAQPGDELRDQGQQEVRRGVGDKVQERVLEWWEKRIIVMFRELRTRTSTAEKLQEEER